MIILSHIVLYSGRRLVLPGDTTRLISCEVDQRSLKKSSAKMVLDSPERLVNLTHFPTRLVRVSC